MGPEANLDAVRLTVPIAVAVLAVSGSPLGAQQPRKTPDVYFAATPQAVADAMLQLARVTSGDLVYDLGSGDGRIVILAAQKYGARGVGIELDEALIERSRETAREGGVAQRVTFIQDDLFTADIASATVVTLWLSPSINRALEAKLKKELPPGARVVSRQFPIGSWAPTETVHAGDESLYLWTIDPR